jgi:hypothetical protein
LFNIPDIEEKNKTSHQYARFSQTNIDGDILIGLPKARRGKHYAPGVKSPKKRRSKKELLIKTVFVLAIAAFCFSLSMLLFF